MNDMSKNTIINVVNLVICEINNKLNTNFIVNVYPTDDEYFYHVNINKNMLMYIHKNDTFNYIYYEILRMLHDVGLLKISLKIKQNKICT